MAIIKIARRNLGRHRVRTTLLALAIIFSFTFITLFNSFIGSIVENIGENASNLMAGHLFIEGTERIVKGEEDVRIYDYIKDSELIENLIENSGIDYQFLTKSSEIENCTLIYEGNSVLQNIWGTNWNEDSYFVDRIPFYKGSFDLKNQRDGLIVGKAIANKLKIDVGDFVIARFKTYTGQYNAADFKIIAITNDTGFAGSQLAYANFSYVNELLNLSQDQYMAVGLYLKDMNKNFKRLDEIADLLYSKLGEKVSLFKREEGGGSDNPIKKMIEQLKNADWEGSKYRLTSLNDILSVVKNISLWVTIIGYVILAIMLIVVFIGLFNTFWIVMLERTKEVGTLRAIGMQRKSVLKMFLVESFFLGGIGLLGGTFFALILMAFIHSFNFGTNTIIFIIMKNGHITFSLPWWQALLNVIIILCVVLLGAIIPAYKASRLSPAEAFRSIN